MKSNVKEKPVCSHCGAKVWVETEADIEVVR